MRLGPDIRCNRAPLEVSMADIVLWHFPISHFNEKVRWALDFKGIPHVRRALFWSYLPRSLWHTGRPGLPILFLDGKAIGDSTRIIEALERFQPEPRLYPPDAAERRRALLLEDFFDEELGHSIRTALLGPMFASAPEAAIAGLTLGQGDGVRRSVELLFKPFRAFYTYRHGINAETIRNAPAQVEAAMDRLEAELQPSGYLVGNTFSVADLTAAALFVPLVWPPEFPAPGPLPEAFEAYRRSVSQRPAFRWVEEMFRRHRAPAGAAARTGSGGASHRGPAEASTRSSSARPG
jgi:glutathione S-transferase